MRCSRCVMDESVPGIEFDSDGECNYCKQHDAMAKKYPGGPEGAVILAQLVEKIKKSGKNKPYDCVVGISGGCDSSYLLDVAVTNGLRPLAVHSDNGWNTDIAEHNMKCVLDKLCVGCIRFRCDLDEYDNITRAFLHAGVPELDAPADVALATCAYKAADMYGIKYILNGHVFRTEGITPPGWFYFDGKYVDDVSGSIIKTFPNLWLRDWLWWTIVKRIRHVRPLYYFDYDKEKIKQHLKDKFGWKWYGGHHKENVLTEFCDDCYLYRRFCIDLRLVEYSALIRSGQMERVDALDRLDFPSVLNTDTVQIVLDNLAVDGGCTEFGFLRNVLCASAHNHTEFETYRPWFRRLRPLFWVMSKLDLVPQTFYEKYTK